MQTNHLKSRENVWMYWKWMKKLADGRHSKRLLESLSPLSLVRNEISFPPLSCKWLITLEILSLHQSSRRTPLSPVFILKWRCYKWENEPTLLQQRWSSTHADSFLSFVSDFRKVLVSFLVTVPSWESALILDFCSFLVANTRNHKSSWVKLVYLS